MNLWSFLDKNFFGLGLLLVVTVLAWKAPLFVAALLSASEPSRPCPPCSCPGSP